MPELAYQGTHKKVKKYPPYLNRTDFMQVLLVPQGTVVGLKKRLFSIKSKLKYINIGEFLTENTILSTVKNFGEVFGLI